MQGIDHSRVHVLPEGTCVPGWDDIKDIISDLRRVLDGIGDANAVEPGMRAPIARVIAQMREEKMLEQDYGRCKALLDGLESFWLRDAGILP